MQYSGLRVSSPLTARLQGLGICLQHFVNRNRTPHEIGPIWKSHSARLSRSYVVINDGEKTSKPQSAYVKLDEGLSPRDPTTHRIGRSVGEPVEKSTCC